MKLQAPTDFMSTSPTVSAGAAAASSYKHRPSQGRLPASNSVRFTLRKRSLRSDEDGSATDGKSAFNADFLSGLFADIAQANVLSELEISPSATTATATDNTIKDDDDDHVISRPSKKSRLSLSLNATSFRARPSVKNLLSLVDQQEDGDSSSSDQGPESPRCMDDELRQRTNSLAMQLNSLTSSDVAEASTHEVLPSPQGSPRSQKKTVVRKSLADDAVRLAFPNLPHTVSASSSISGLTRVDSSLQQQTAGPAEETGQAKEQFGWFVDLDEYHGAANANDPKDGMAAMPYSVSSDNLAFKAPVAPALLAAGPEVADHEAEVEWAKAADTVDDVLGDFF
mmetsp:Transcript_7954/g.19911  ORF Transcript_7954/g.19911 Transcript_7954/m.19911 type:complete len:340 (-) Transcript_7954:1681-2700(-)|eukprot:CAMPEP_0113492940 /NCGR_PEP_ID=MMETSP0014_2-20120614/28335_1 /TAXON_ID=2857 /ORGANISM="Nitzschia sp." /LENGTH=339 /DNA_ID=CAMNT_0000386787 /DNA_START=363 /DNA_END=1382 /DNA_ORIENTATION=+ /assembly_acc=CAM_ASM_000159